MNIQLTYWVSTCSEHAVNILSTVNIQWMYSEHIVSILSTVNHGSAALDLLTYSSGAHCSGQWEPQPRECANSVEVSHTYPEELEFWLTPSFWSAYTDAYSLGSRLPWNVVSYVVQMQWLYPRALRQLCCMSWGPTWKEVQPSFI